VDTRVTRKLVLFDVDGTLILTGGIAAGLMAESVSSILNKPIQWTMDHFIGNTDRNIIHTLLRQNGIGESILEDLTDKVLEKYLMDLKSKLKKDSIVKILPGVKNLLDVLSIDHRFDLGLLTGNVKRGAQLKLSAKNLFKYFPVGAFGNDALQRKLLPPIAIQRAEKYYNRFFEKKDIWIIGDSIPDIECARTNHIRILVVFSGFTKKEELKKFNPDAYLENLSNINRVKQILLS
jgi:phosphoglycolate phosphatase